MTWGEMWRYAILTVIVGLTVAVVHVVSSLAITYGNLRLFHLGGW